jgi:cholesterol transport system auxiliary component
MKTFLHRRTGAGAVSLAAVAMPMLVAWAVLGLSGCGASLLPRPPAAAARYTLDAVASAPAASAMPDSPVAPAVSPQAAANAPVLLLAPPSAAPGYDSVHMLFQRQPQQLEAFAFHEWVEPPARLLAPLMVQALQATGAFRAVLLAPTSGTGALRLETEIVRLQQDFSAQPSAVRLTLRAALIDAGTRRVIATQVFDARVPANADNPVAGVAAAQLATRRVLGELAVACAQWARGAPASLAAPPR